MNALLDLVTFLHYFYSSLIIEVFWYRMPTRVVLIFSMYFQTFMLPGAHMVGNKYKKIY